MDIQSLDYWNDYSKVKDKMMLYTSIKKSPWNDVPSDVKKHARLNCISHLLTQIPYEKNPVPEPIEFPEKREIKGHYVRIPMSEVPFVPNHVKQFLKK